jgi:hypothetical protein
MQDLSDGRAFRNAVATADLKASDICDLQDAGLLQIKDDGMGEARNTEEQGE